MARILHTAVADELHELERTDPERAAEMRMESVEYANEVRGFYDHDEDPADMDECERDFDDDPRDFDDDIEPEFDE